MTTDKLQPCGGHYEVDPANPCEDCARVQPATWDDVDKAGKLLKELLEEQQIVDMKGVEVQVRRIGDAINPDDFDRFLGDLTEYAVDLTNMVTDEKVRNTDLQRVHQMQAAITVAVAGLTAVTAMSDLFSMIDREEMSDDG